MSRLISQTDPRGKVTGFTYNGLNQISGITDPSGGVTELAYDANGNLISITDPRGGVTVYGYNSKDQVATRTDPVGATESFHYDATGNLVRWIDRKGQQTQFSYDALNRRVVGSYHDGTITSEADRYYTEQFRPNPATGPVAVEGAQPGDALALEILEIRPGPLGYTTIRPTWGLITGVVDRSQAKILRVEGNDVVFAPGVRFPVRPMIGTIGTAPAGEPVSNMYAGPHGGNMDNNDVAPGATVFLPVFVPGGLFGLGDVHASMGDGELSGGGFDVPAEVTLRVGLRKGLRLRWPRIERDGHVITTGAHGDPLEAMRLAVEEMVGLLGEHLRLGRADALMLLSVRGDPTPGTSRTAGTSMPPTCQAWCGVRPDQATRRWR